MTADDLAEEEWPVEKKGKKGKKGQGKKGKAAADEDEDGGETQPQGMSYLWLLVSQIYK